MPFTYISYEDMDNYLTEKGFSIIYLPNVKETVYSKVIARNVCIRVYTSIENGICRSKGEDAIRVVIVRRYQNGTIKPIAGSTGRVNRTANWKNNLTIRINNAIKLYEDTVYAR